jgi:hypothetical protein
VELAHLVRARRLMRRLLAEPLVQFLALGAAIFALNAVLHPEPPATDTARIEITRADVERLRALYAQQWGAPPADSDLPRLIDGYVREEVLFREARAIGLADGDSIVRNRLVQKMEFLLQPAEGQAEPSAAELARWLDDHAEAYRLPEQVTFTQLYFSGRVRGDRAAADARAALAALRAGTPAAGRGDAFMLAGDQGPLTRDEVERDFGAAFAEAVFTAAPGGWLGPVTSAYGVHLVRVTEHRPGRPPALAEVRDKVRADLLQERADTARRAALDRLRARYEIRLAPDALPAPAVAQR